MRTRTKALLIAASAGVAAALSAAPAQARPAVCSVTGEGRYDCDFTQQGGDGSFTITARGRDTWIFVMNGDGTAFAFIRVDGQGRNVAVAGMFTRSARDTACWTNPDIQTTVCARAAPARRR